jgi:hypothetical protein
MDVRMIEAGHLSVPGDVRLGTPDDRAERD